ncbi:MAG TPA: FprA family A-type flavoprotein [Anaerolineae bacterium]|nr:FprA family A-type flavoprotein [Anaerolineae bacterium]HOQ97713.1 FprA family A-type flavoprotein [Anaerolineae bacterium]HPL26861.1 FprA family A-type flavoprotein [Anaerolineae bacterium]
MQPVSLADGVYWAGVLNPDLRVFDVIMRTAHGTSYNAYLVRGEKTALIDTVKHGFEDAFLARIRAVVDPQAIDYIIINHAEPDHSGALARLLDEAPRAQLIVSRSGEHFLRHILNRDVPMRKVGDGDRLELGGKTLRFVSAPFLHWPDTMFTYLEEEAILFPCDVLGAHYATEQLFDDLVGDFAEEWRYYFDVIMRPFKDKMLEALAKIDGWPLRLIAPSHGPILRTDPQRYVDLYRAWSTTPVRGPSRRVVVAYVSAYGNTRRMAEAVAAGAQEAGAQVRLVDAEHEAAAGLLDEIEAADALIAGSSTIVGDAIKPIWDLLSSLTTLRLKGKVGGVFGSYGWSGEAIPMLEERLKGLKLKLPEPAVKAILVPTAENLAACRELGRRIVTQHLA